jgi:tetratricopeptide (TPR) repeat protein
MKMALFTRSWARLGLSTLLALGLLTGCAAVPSSTSSNSASTPSLTDEQRLFRLAQRAEQQGNAGLAIGLYRQSLAAHGDAGSRQALYWLYRRHGEAQQAQALLQQQPWPKYGQRCASAAQLMDQHQWQAAAQALSDIGLDERWSHCAAMQARLALQQGRLEQAQTLFGQLQRWHPQAWQHSYNLALLALLQQQPRLAIVRLQRLCSVPKQCPRPVAELTALALVFAGQEQQARQWLAEAGVSEAALQTQLNYFRQLQTGQQP